MIQVGDGGYHMEFISAQLDKAFSKIKIVDGSLDKEDRFCVYEAFLKLGWLYGPYMPQKPGACPDIKTSVQIVHGKLGTMYDDRKRTLFLGMLGMLEYMDERTSESTFYFGTDDFSHVWEKLVDKAFGERNKNQYFPRTRWLLDFGK